MLGLVLQEPCHHILPDTLSVGLDDISVAGNNPIKVPVSNALHGSSELRAILLRQNVPGKASLASRRRSNLEHGQYHLGKAVQRVGIRSLGVLLSSRQIEEHVGFDKRARRAVQED